MKTNKIFFPCLSAELLKAKREVKSVRRDFTDSEVWLSLNVSRAKFYKV